MRLKQLFNSDFYVCEWTARQDSGQFAVIQATLSDAQEDAHRFLDRQKLMSPSTIHYTLRRPTLIERIKAI